MTDFLFEFFLLIRYFVVALISFDCPGVSLADEIPEGAGREPLRRPAQGIHLEDPQVGAGGAWLWSCRTTDYGPEVGWPCLHTLAIHRYSIDRVLLQF